mgnify:CR=1 FL=1
MINFGCEMVIDGSEYQFVRDKAKAVGNIDTNVKVSDRIKNLDKLRSFVKSKLKSAHEKTKHDYNLRHRLVQYVVGDRVWKREHTLSSAARDYSAKLGLKYTGPFRIKRKLGINVYELEDNNGISKGNWHVSQLKPDKTSSDLQLDDDE